MAEKTRAETESSVAGDAAIVERFRATWVAGARPSIAEFLVDADNSRFGPLFLSLLEIDWQERLNLGESPQLEQYLQVFPHHVELLDDFFNRRGESVDRSFSSTTSFGPRDSTVSGKLLAPGDRLGRYVLESELGQGGFGVVWRANDPELGRAVAIKVLRPDRNDQHMQASMLNEARKIAQLSHDSILKVHDVLRAGENICIVTELLTGGSLAERISTYAGRPWEAADLVRRVAGALHHAHVQGVVHRDVKPRNILLSADGGPRLADFGLAVTEAEQLAEKRCALGTMAYMPPEVARGDCHYADPRSDIYSLGIVFYQLLTQRLPYVAENAEQWVRQTIEREPRPPRTIDDRVPAELERIVLTCLSKSITSRYTTARDLADDISAAIRTSGAVDSHSQEKSTSGRSSRTETATWSNQPRAKVARLPVIIALTAALCGAVAFVMSRLNSENGKPTAKPSVAVPKLEGAEEADAADPIAELDRAPPKPGVWVAVLKSAPLSLMQSRRDQVLLRHDARDGTLQVMDSGWSLLELGHTDSPHLEMQVAFSQPAWEGGLGFFFGFNDSAELGPAVKRFQTMRVARSSDGGKDRLQVFWTFMEVDELGVVRRRHEAPLGGPVPIPARPQRLELRIEDQQVSIRLGPETAWVASTQPLRWIGPADFQGKFGLFVNEASGTFSNARVKIPTRDDNP